MPTDRRSLVLAAVLLAMPGVWSAAHAAANNDDRIIVSGASGQLGLLTVKELLARGVKPANLILVSRTTDKLAEYAAMGASVRYGDLYKPESLPAAYAGGTKLLLISITPGASPRPEAHNAGFQAAVKAGVRHIVYTSFTGADKGESALAADHQKSENYLRASGARWTALRNAFYADRVAQQAIEMARTGRASVRPGEAKSAPVTRADCAAAAAGALLNDWSANQAYGITGPALFDTRDIAAAVTAITGKPIEIVEAAAAGGGPMPAPAVVSDAVAKLAGRPGQGLAAILEANRAALLSAR